MSHKITKTGLMAILSTVVIGLTSCGSVSISQESDPVASAVLSIVATSGTPQSHTIDGVFAMPLAAMVMAGGAPASGMVVTFAAPVSGASGIFADTHSNTTTAVTDASGLATAAVFTANGTTGAYAVTASVAGAPVSAGFSLTNKMPSNVYVFSLSGQQASGPNFYALAGSVEIDSIGTVIAGEQDFNDARGFTSPQPAGDSIVGGSLNVDSSTGLGTLTLKTTNRNFGIGGVETLAVQFVNSRHAVIMQFDGSATSSGSMDFQTLPGSLSGGFAFTMAGVDPLYLPVAWGGVFTISNGTALRNGIVDTNDDGLVIKGIALSGTLSTPDSYGRGAISSTLNYNGAPVALNYYIVGPEAVRIIDVNEFESALGSAYGQGTNATDSTNASLGNSVFGIAGTPFLIHYGAVGMLFPRNTSLAVGDFSGVADDNESSYALLFQASPISGTYSVVSNGYGSLALAPGLGHVGYLGIYMTDPNLNLSDPNDTISGLGGALAADMDSFLPGGTGILIPQIDTSTASFAGPYAFSAQDINGFCCEFDLIGQSSVTAGIFAGTALLSDPLLTLGASAANSNVAVSANPLADPVNAGRYTMLATNAALNPLAVTINGTTRDFDAVIYQAGGGQLLWLGEDTFDVFFGSLQQQGSLTGVPAARRIGN